MDHEMIKYLAELSKLYFTEEELEDNAIQMTNIVNLMDSIKEIDIEYNPLADNHNVYLPDLREDQNTPSLETSKVLQNSVNSNNCFVVPKVVE